MNTRSGTVSRPGRGLFGVPTLDDFDPFAAVETWVEQGGAPERIPAGGEASLGRDRPLCPYPLEAHHTGGDPHCADALTRRPPRP